MKQIPLSKGGFTLVDEQDFGELSQYVWYKGATGYVERSLRDGKFTKHIKMHHHLLGKPPVGKVTDHKNTDKLDNRRENLRFCSQSLNNLNKHTYRNGVYWVKSRKKWTINTSIAGKSLYVGVFDTQEEAESVAALIHGALMYHELTKGG